MDTEEARAIVKRDYPKAEAVQTGGRWIIVSGVRVPISLGGGKTAAEAWERAAGEVNYSNGIDG